MNQNRIIRIIPQRNQFNIIGNQENQQNQRMEEGALQLHQGENNNLLENEQIQEIPDLRVVPREQNNNNIENQMEIIAPQVIDNRQQNVNVNFNPNNIVTKEEFYTFKNDMLLFKNQVNRNFANINNKLDDIYQSINSNKVVQNNNINNNI